jgi:hypothetical protein
MKKKQLKHQIFKIVALNWLKLIVKIFDDEGQQMQQQNNKTSIVVNTGTYRPMKLHIKSWDNRRAPKDGEILLLHSMMQQQNNKTTKQLLQAHETACRILRWLASSERWKSFAVAFDDVGHRLRLPNRRTCWHSHSFWKTEKKIQIFCLIKKLS